LFHVTACRLPGPQFADFPNLPSLLFENPWTLRSRFSWATLPASPRPRCRVVNVSSLRHFGDAGSVAYGDVLRESCMGMVSIECCR